MTSHLVEGRPLPDAVAGHPALELCNTRAIWGSTAPKEYLHDYLTLLLWAREHELLTAAETTELRREGEGDPEGAELVLRRVLRLRDHLYAVVTSAGDPMAEEALQRLVVDAARVSTYRRTADGPMRLDGGSGLGSPLHRAALAAHDLLIGPGPGAVGLCYGEGCGWVFLDPAHRRHWCVMAVCGNRAKVRRYAERRRDERPVRRSGGSAG